MADFLSSEFPFTSHYIEIKGSKLHYIDEGKGDPILFIHGIPTSSYVWRNVIPSLKDSGRCIAVDLPGFGRSDKPDIKYTVFDHIEYVNAFIQALGLKSVTLVLHGWGSLIGFHYAMLHSDNVKGLAFFESYLFPPHSPHMVSLLLQELATVLSLPDGGFDVIMNSNYFLNKILNVGTLRRLGDAELAAYQAPFLQPGTCRPIWQYLQELPLGNKKTKVTDMMAKYSKFLTQSSIPKLMLYAIPGFTTTIDTIIWARDHLPALTLVDLGDGLHYLQESDPELIASAIADWQKTIPLKESRRLAQRDKVSVGEL